MNTTQAVMFGATVGLILYDFYAVIRHGAQATISWQFIELSKTHPFLPFLLGVLAGHLTTQLS